VPAYAPSTDAFDETVNGSERVRDRYSELLRIVESRGPADVRDRIQAEMGREGVCFKTAHGRKPFHVDPIARLLDPDEWSRLERGLVQRADALEAFIVDAYSDQRIVAAGELPERVIATSRLFDERLRGLEVPHYVFVYGPDVVRDANGELVVLEDNLRTPSGIAYLLALREALATEFGSELEGVRELDPGLSQLDEALRLATPAGVDDPTIAVITDGRESPAFYEHCELARRLDVMLVELGDLEPADGELTVRGEDGRRRRIDVLYRRTDEAAFTGPDGELTPIARALKEPIEAGTLGVANAFGAGVGDDKLAHAYAESMIRFYLSEEPILRSVRTLDLGAQEQLEEAVSRVDELVVKERHRAGGLGVVVEPEDTQEGADGVREAIARRGDELIAQERVALSTVPTVARRGERIEPRRVDLRPFIIRTRDGWRGVPGGLTRFAAKPDSLIVNSTQGGGGKDTWLLK
jgi:uncharacterized circularly permuted ATP-grasp superfamily protein